MKQKHDAVGKAFASRKVKLRDVLEDPERFQMRERKSTDPTHVDDLVKALKRGDKLPPVMVWEDPKAGRLLVLDGHHRIAAHRKAQAKTIAAKVFQGDFRDALLVAFEANKDARLPVTNKDRQDAAWRLVCQWTEADGYTYSIAEVVKSAGVSRTQVTIMRKVRKTLGATSKDAPKSWLAAKMEADGKTQGELKDEDRDAMLEAQVNEIRAKIGKQITDAGYRSPQAFAVALQTCLGENYHEVISFMGLKKDDDEDDDYFAPLNCEDEDPDADY